MDATWRAEEVDPSSSAGRPSARRPAGAIVLGCFVATGLELAGVAAAVSYGAWQLAAARVPAPMCTPSPLSCPPAGSRFAESTSWWRLFVFAPAAGLLLFTIAGGLVAVSGLLAGRPVAVNRTARGRYATLATAGLSLAAGLVAAWVLVSLASNGAPLADLVLSAAVAALGLVTGLSSLAVLWQSRARLEGARAGTTLAGVAALAAALALSLQVGAGAFVLAPGAGATVLPVLQRGFHLPRLADYGSAVTAVLGGSCADGAHCALTVLLAQPEAVGPSARAGTGPNLLPALASTADGGRHWQIEELGLAPGALISAPACVGRRCLVVEGTVGGERSAVLEVDPWGRFGERDVASFAGSLSAFSCTADGSCLAVRSRLGQAVGLVRSARLGTPQPLALPAALSASSTTGWSVAVSCSGSSCLLSAWPASGDEAGTPAPSGGAGGPPPSLAAAGPPPSLDLVSADGGLTWAAVDVPAGTTLPSSFACTPLGQCIAGSSNDGGGSILSSYDGGAHFADAADVLGTVSGLACPPSGGCTAAVDDAASVTTLTALFDPFPPDGSAVQVVPARLGADMVRLGGLDLLSCPQAGVCLASVALAVTGSDGVVRDVPFVGVTSTGGKGWVFSPLPSLGGSASAR